MPESSTLKLRLLGAFAIEASAERPAAPAIRSRKARALLAYLAMKPDWRAGREELATLLWRACASMPGVAAPGSPSHRARSPRYRSRDDRAARAGPDG